MSGKNTRGQKSRRKITPRNLPNDVQDLTGNLLTIICKDVNIELKLLPMTRETFEYQTANSSNKARVDIRARGFLDRIQVVFLDVRVFHPNARIFYPNPSRYLKKALPKEKNESTTMDCMFLSCHVLFSE